MYLNDVVNEIKIDGLYQVIFSNSLYLVNVWFYELPGFEIIIKNWAFRVNCNYLYFRVLFLEIFSSPAQCAASANSGNKIINVSTCLFPYLRSGGVIVRVNIPGIIVLVWIIWIWSFSGYSFGDAVITFRRIWRDVRGCYDNFRPKSPHQVLFFVAHFIRHGDYALVALYCGNHGKGGAGIARWIFYYGTTGF